MNRSLPSMVAASLLLLSLVATGCGDDDDADGDGGPVAVDVWARPTAPGAETAAFYFELGNGGTEADRLVDAESPACTSTMLHRSSMTDGVMSMQPATDDELTVAPAGTVMFEPGGLHVMCMGLVDPLVEGESVPLVLTFETAGSLTLSADVEDR